MNTLALLPNLAGPDMLIIFLIVLIMFGAKKLPELAKGLGQAVREFAKAKEDMNSEIHRAAHVENPVYHAPVEHGLPPAPAAAAPVSAVAASPAAPSAPVPPATAPYEPVPAATAPAPAVPASAPVTAGTVTGSQPHA